MSRLKVSDKRLIWSYLTGFGLSLGVTLVAFTLVMMQVSSDGTAYPRDLLIIGLVLLAIIQLVVQLLFFFHLGKESKPRLNTMSFLFMTMVISIIGFGSLWIMYNLDYNMMEPKEVELHIQQEENIFKSDQGHE